MRQRRTRPLSAASPPSRPRARKTTQPRAQSPESLPNLARSAHRACGAPIAALEPLQPRVRAGRQPGMRRRPPCAGGAIGTSVVRCEASLPQALRALRSSRRHRPDQREASPNSLSTLPRSFRLIRTTTRKRMRQDTASHDFVRRRSGRQPRCQHSPNHQPAPLGLRRSPPKPPRMERLRHTEAPRRPRRHTTTATAALGRATSYKTPAARRGSPGIALALVLSPPPPPLRRPTSSAPASAAPAPHLCRRGRKG